MSTNLSNVLFFGFPTHIFTLFTVMKYESKGQKNTGLPKSFTMLLRMKLETFLLDNRVIVLRNFCNLSLSLGQSSNFLFQSLKSLKMLLKNTTEFTDETSSTISQVHSVLYLLNYFIKKSSMYLAFATLKKNWQRYWLFTFGS